jgi:putative oxidoreductase
VLTLLRPATTTPALKDVVLLLARVGLGLVLVAHGWQKWSTFTLDGTAASFADMGIPAPAAAALFAAVVELSGGLALIAGLLTPVFALLNVANLLGALVLVHIGNGPFVADNGYELVVALIAGLLVVAALGAGRYSADEALTRRTQNA